MYPNMGVAFLLSKNGPIPYNSVFKLYMEDTKSKKINPQLVHVAYGSRPKKIYIWD